MNGSGRDPRLRRHRCSVKAVWIPACMEAPLTPRLSWIPAFAGMTTPASIPSFREGGKPLIFGPIAVADSFTDHE